MSQMSNPGCGSSRSSTRRIRVELGFYVFGEAAAMDVAVNGDRAYVATDAGGLRVLSVADPAYPVEVGYYGLPHPAYGVVVAGDYVYLADFLTGLQILQYFGGGVEETPSAARSGLRSTCLRWSGGCWCSAQ